jgi:tellurite methyltransferase
MSKANTYDERYAGEEYYWGKKPSALCDGVIEMIHRNKDFRPELIDLSCGEGRNVVYFAKRRFEAMGHDLSEACLKKVQKCAEKEGTARAAIFQKMRKVSLASLFETLQHAFRLDSF